MQAKPARLQTKDMNFPRKNWRITTTFPIRSMSTDRCYITELSNEYCAESPGHHIRFRQVSFHTFSAKKTEKTDT